MKISLENLNRIIEKCTKKEIDLLIYIGQFQDDYGVIKGIDYKDVLNNIYICKSTFYKLLYSLEQKEILKINFFSEHAYWEVELLNNVFKCKDDYKKGYLKLNYEVLHSKEFKNMTKSEKIIIINLLKINDLKKAMIKITYKRLMEWTGKSLRSVKKFVVTLSKVLKIIKRDDLCLIDCVFGFSTRNLSESNVRNKHLIDYRLKKAKCQSDKKDVEDTIIVLKQYKIKCTETIIKILDNTINMFGELAPKYINKLANALSYSK